VTAWAGLTVITLKLLMMNAISTSQIVSFIICSILLIEKLVCCYVAMETTKYTSVTKQTQNDGFHMN